MNRPSQSGTALYCRMPTTHARCDRVPPTQYGDYTKWRDFDMSALREDDLPLDPRTWARTDVARWVARRGGLPERFPMNGKALCLMTKDMFGARVPGSGLALHQDFQRRLAKALALQDLLETMTFK